MKQIIEIEVPEGYKAVYNKDTQKIEIVDIALPKTWEEFCENNPVKRSECFIHNGDIMNVIIEGLRSTTTKSILPNKETAEAFIALMQLIQLRDCYRQGWKPDWQDGTEKYIIVQYDNTISSEVNQRISKVLSFQSPNIRSKFLHNFRDLIEKAKELI